MVHITDKAISAVKDYLHKEKKDHYGLRIVAQQGCCSLQYGFFLAEKGKDDDTVLQQGGITFYVDPQSGTWLEGAKVDYQVGEQGEGFYIENPNEAKMEGSGGCGCGGGGCGCGGHG